VPVNAPLLLPLVTKGYIVPEVPVFYVVARGTEFYDHMTRSQARIPTLVVPDMSAGAE
jgi:hypothetical protein